MFVGTHNLCFGSKIRKIVDPCKPQFYYIKVDLKGYILHGHVFPMTGHDCDKEWVALMLQ